METTNKISLSSSIIQIGERLKSQDNHCTEEPIFIVQSKRRIYGIDTQYTDDAEWIDNEGEEADKETKEKLEDKYLEDGLEEIDGYVRTAVLDIWEFRTACFTEVGAKNYIAKMAHRLNEPRIFVESAYRNEEWKEVRAFLKSCE